MHKRWSNIGSDQIADLIVITLFFGNNTLNLSLHQETRKYLGEDLDFSYGSSFLPLHWKIRKVTISDQTAKARPKIAAKRGRSRVTCILIKTSHHCDTADSADTVDTADTVDSDTADSDIADRAETGDNGDANPGLSRPRGLGLTSDGTYHQVEPV